LEDTDVSWSLIMADGTFRSKADGPWSDFAQIEMLAGGTALFFTEDPVSLISIQVGDRLHHWPVPDVPVFSHVRWSAYLGVSGAIGAVWLYTVFGYRLGDYYLCLFFGPTLTRIQAIPVTTPTIF